MTHFSRYNKPDKKIITEYLLPIAIQLAIFPILMFIHNPIVKRGALIQTPEEVCGSMSTPTVGRLVYLIIAPILIGVAIYFANYFDKKKKDIFCFICADVAGIIIWQFLGEDFWHFSIGGIHFLTFETIQALPIVLINIALLIYFGFKKNKNWSLWLALIVFSYNWFGHYITEGLYPFVANSLSFHDWATIIAPSLCTPIILFSVYLGLFMSKDKKGRYLSSILTFASVSILLMSLIHA